MAATFDVTCPNCATPLKVPTALAGKKVKCKQCQQVLTVPAGPAPAKAVPVKPVEDQPAAYQSAAEKRFAQEAEDEADDKSDYIVIKESDAPRCPHCAKELDPPDSKICLNCGYNTLTRQRKESRKVYDPTFGDWFQHLGPAVFCFLLAAGLITGAVICWIDMPDWLDGSLLQSDEKNPTTLKKTWLVQPWCFSLWIMVMVLWVSYKLAKFSIKRFIYHFRPPERIKR
ncbi:MAG TPA: hypothetical protein VGJ05_13300 [Fimbriiglobus sp.]|jgi:predicted Zn finger-like uncharacterized protein